MFSVCTSSDQASGKETPAFQRHCLPSIDEIVTAVGIATVHGVIIEVGLSMPLPVEQVDVYVDGSVNGSYDGWGVRVSCYTVFDRNRTDVTLREVAQRVIDLYMAIVHGTIKGKYRLAREAAEAAKSAGAGQD